MLEKLKDLLSKTEYGPKWWETKNKKQKSSSSLQVENSNSMLTSLAHNQTKATFLFSRFHCSRPYTVTVSFDRIDLGGSRCTTSWRDTSYSTGICYIKTNFIFPKSFPQPTPKLWYCGLVVVVFHCFMNNLHSTIGRSPFEQGLGVQTNETH